MTISTKRIGAKIVLYEDGTAAVSVFLIEADGEQKFLSYQNAAGSQGRRSGRSCPCRR